MPLAELTQHTSLIMGSVAWNNKDFSHSLWWPILVWTWICDGVLNEVQLARTYTESKQPHFSTMN